jgi:hypothetical protein
MEGETIEELERMELLFCVFDDDELDRQGGQYIERRRVLTAECLSTYVLNKAKDKMLYCHYCLVHVLAIFLLQ